MHGTSSIDIRIFWQATLHRPRKGTRTKFKYVPLISGGQKPAIEEKDEFKVMIPYLMAGPAAITTGNTTEKTTEKTTGKILQIIRGNPKIRMDELAIACNLTSDGIFYHIKKLKRQGILSLEGGAMDCR